MNIDGTVIRRAATLLKSARSAEAEREALSEIVREYTAQLARELGGAPDRPGSPLQMAGQYGQMDCLDETANTTSLLVELTRGVCSRTTTSSRPESRGFFFDGRYPHFTAVIAEDKDRHRMGGRSLEARTRAKAGYPAAIAMAAGFLSELITS